jgi:GNAT superfamily N-acetyltransferase
MVCRQFFAEEFSMAAAFRIRDAKLPDEEPTLAGFIAGLQGFEHAFEPDRRIDARVGADYCAVLISRARECHGRILVADADGDGLLGWAVVHEAGNESFVVDDERIYGYLSELFVVERARRLGVGRALLTACEDWARERKLKTMMIGVLPGNQRALRIYQEAGFSPYSVRLRKYL